MKTFEEVQEKIEKQVTRLNIAIDVIVEIPGSCDVLNQTLGILLRERLRLTSLSKEQIQEALRKSNEWSPFSPTLNGLIEWKNTF